MYGYGNKLELRDLQLPNHRKKLMDSIEKDFINDENVLALFYGGSIGSDNSDLYSDIDLRIVVKPEKIKEYIANKNIRPNDWGNVLFIEDVNPHSIYTVAHFDSFLKVDTFYYRPSDLQPSVWLNNIKIIKDTDEMMKGILDTSLQLHYEPTIEEFEFWRTKIFAYLHEAYRRVMRGEYYYALQCVDRLRLSMVTAWYMEANILPNTFGDWAKYEGERSHLHEWQHSHLNNWECGRDKGEILTVLKSIVPDFIRIHKSLCEKLGVEENSEWVDRIVRMVV